MFDRELEHLVEIAVVEPAVPSDREYGATHDTGGSRRIECIGEAVHIAGIVAALDKKLQKPADRHIGDRVEAVEYDAEPGEELPFEQGFRRLLFGRQECTDRVVDQVQGEPAPILSIPQTVQDADGLDRLVEDAVSSLSVGLRRAIIGQGRDDFDLMGGKKAGKVLLRGYEQHGQVTAIYHMPVQ